MIPVLAEALEAFPGLRKVFNGRVLVELHDWAHLGAAFDPVTVAEWGARLSTTERVMLAAILARADYGTQADEVWPHGFGRLLDSGITAAELALVFRVLMDGREV